MTKTKQHNRMAKRPHMKDRDSIQFSGTVQINAGITASNIGFDYHLVNCQATYGIARSHGTITDSFQLYRYKNVKVKWIPFIGPSATDAGAIVKFQYLTNPEDMFYIQNTATASSANTLMLNTYDFKQFNAYKSFVYNLPLAKKNRRTWYSVDTIFTSSINDYERNSQGIILATYQNTTTAAIVLGSFEITYTLELKGLSSSPGT